MRTVDHIRLYLHTENKLACLACSVHKLRDVKSSVGLLFFLSLAVYSIQVGGISRNFFIKHVTFEINILEDKQGFIVFLNGKNTAEQLFKPA